MAALWGCVPSVKMRMAGPFVMSLTQQAGRKALSQSGCLGNLRTDLPAKRELVLFMVAWSTKPRAHT